LLSNSAYAEHERFSTLQNAVAKELAVIHEASNRHAAEKAIDFYGKGKMA